MPFPTSTYVHYLLSATPPLLPFFLFFVFLLQGPVGGVEEVPPFQPQVHTYVCDVGKRESVYSTAEKVRREVGDVDILINNAGVVSGHHLLECPDELIERTMVVNCHAHFWVSRWFVNRCKRGRGFGPQCGTCRTKHLHAYNQPSLLCVHLRLRSCTKKKKSPLQLPSYNIHLLSDCVKPFPCCSSAAPLVLIQIIQHPHPHPRPLPFFFLPCLIEMMTL